MTRFARAKGSKASNERAPEDSTPWAVMKEQLVRAKQDAEHAHLREQAEKQRLENYEKFLNDRKTAKRKSTWCDFSGENEKPSGPPVTRSGEPAPPHSHLSQPQPLLPKKSKKHKKSTQEESSHIDTQGTDNTADNVLSKKTKKKKKKRIDIADEETTHNATEIQTTSSTSETKDELSKTKKEKKNKNKNKQSSDNATSVAEHDNETLFENTTDNTVSPPAAKLAHTKQKKKKKLDNGKAVRRKADDERSFQIIINGREVELVRYDGFPVMRRDAERLEELRRSMAAKGIPKSEVQRTMKLERRRAEKALARLKRDVCYNCRKGGHNLSDCPELRERLAEPGAASGADGVCFKCGSTEHRQFECKVQRNQEYRFASCFICKEQGHIARQCPDNPKGLYPNGGGCKLCGDVTHLRKDCPTTKSEREETSVRVDTLAATDDLEGISQASHHPVPAAAAAAADRKPKKIKF